MISSLLKNSILRAYGTSLLGVASGLLTNLWLLREITRMIPVQDFGIYAFALQITGYLAILQLGLDFAASRQIAESLGRNNWQEASRAFAEIARFNRKIVFVVALGVLALSALLWGGLNLGKTLDPESSRLAAQVALVAGLSQVISFLARPYSAALIGSQFQATVNIATVVRTIATTLLGFAFLRSGFYVLSVPVAEVVMQLVLLLVMRKLTKQRCRWLQRPGESAGKKVIGSMLRYGWLTSLGGFAWTLEAGMDVVILGLFAPADVVAAYVLWWRFPQMIFDLCSRLAFSAFPRFSHSFGVSRDAARDIFSKLAYVTLGLSTLALVGISCWLRPFVQLWIGADYLAEQSAYLAVAMGLLVCLRACGNLLGMFWLASGQAGLTTSLSWIQAALKIVLALLLVPKWGVMGVVAASCAASLLQVGAMSFFLGRSKLLVSGVMIRSVLLLTAAAVIGGISTRWNLVVGWGGLVAGAAATVAIWAAVWGGVAGTGELRKPMVSLIADIARRVRPSKAS